MTTVTFCGASGKGYGFESADADSAWVRGAGLALFAATGSCGRRVVRIVELSGQQDDLRPIWALADAERYGASQVFVRREQSVSARRAAMIDLQLGLSPVCRDTALAMPAPAAAQAHASVSLGEPIRQMEQGYAAAA